MTYATTLPTTCPGAADNVPLQALLDTGQSLELSRGTFVLAVPLIRKFNGQSIIGQGMDATTLVLANGTNDFAIKNAIPAGSDRFWGGTIAGLTIDGNMGNQTTGGGVRIDRGYFCEIADCRILNTKAYAVQVIGTSGVYAAYNKLRNVSCASGLGNGIVLDAYSEFSELYGCNASYYQGGPIAPNYWDEPSVAAGIGLYLKGGNNVIQGGHFDRCRVPICLEFSAGNRLNTATDNALDCAVSVKGACRNHLEMLIGRCDPKLADGVTANPGYGVRRAINLTNISAANRLMPIFHPDTSPPPSPPPTSRLGGWQYHVGGSSGEGQAVNGGKNVVVAAQPTGIAIRFDGASGGP